MGTKAERMQTPVEAIQMMIDDAPITTEGEFIRTANSWLACFGSNVFRIETALISSRRYLGDKYIPAQERIEELKIILRDLMLEHAGEKWIPGDTLRHDLFRQLNVFSPANPAKRP